MKVLFCANLPSPYRVDFFNELGKLCDLTVCYERKSASDRDAKWLPNKAMTYKEVYLNLQPVSTDKSKGRALSQYIVKHQDEIIILTNYSSPACMLAIMTCRIRKIPFWIEYDGGLYKRDTIYKRLIKKILIGKAIGHLTTCEEHICYLQSLGININKIYKYPFTSITDKDLNEAVAMMTMGKEHYRRKLAMTEGKIIISVCQLIHRKGVDLLISAAKMMSNIGIYIIGGDTNKEYLQQAEGCANVHFVSFKTKDEIKEYYCAADMMVLLTREDVWGLVINEAMAFGLPVITTDHCMAGVEMIIRGDNGFIVPVETYKEAVEHICYFFGPDSDRGYMSKKCLETARKYTITQMANRHIEILGSE